MIISINAIELATEIAHKELLEKYGADAFISDDDIFYTEDGMTKYTEKAQGVFDELYDYWLSFITGYETAQQSNLIQ